MALSETSPVGRFVQGDAFTPQLKDQQGNPRVIKNGPNAGQPAPQWFIALAFAKTDPLWIAYKTKLFAECAAAWPSLFPNGVQMHMPNGGCVLPTFATKIIDGDGYDTTGKSNAAKEGFAGHEIVRFTSGYAPKVFPAGRYSPADIIHDPAGCKRGSYLRINGTYVTNENPTKPGMYANIALVEVAGFGPEIVSGPDAGAAFGGAPAALPAGASAIPVATGPLPGGAALPPAAPPMPPTAPMAPAAPPPAPVASAAPQPAAPTPPVTTASPSKTMLPAAGGVTYEAMVAAGWTDELLVANGMMVLAPATPAAPPPPTPPPAVKTLLPGMGDYAAFIAAGWTDEQLIAHGKMAG